MARRWQVLLVTSVAVFMSFLDVTIVNIAFPDISASFPGSSLSRLSWILNAYTIVFAAALVPAGRLADRFGRRRFFFLGVLIFLAASAVCGGATSVGVLIGAHAVQALGGAMLVPASLGLLCPSSRSSVARQPPPSGARRARSRPQPVHLLVESSSTGRAGDRSSS
jgi:MFS family permease